MDIGKINNSKEFLDILMKCLNNIIFIVDEEVIVHDYNECFAKTFKLSKEEIRGKRCGNIIGCLFATKEEKCCGETSLCDECPVRKGLLETLLEKTPVERELVSLKLYVENVLEEKHFYFSTRHVFYDNKKMVLAILDDVTELENSKRVAEKLATIDSLTGINNRRSLFQILVGNLEKARRYGEDFSIIMMDIDEFKSVNDEYGHQEGDLVLKNVTDAIKKELRIPDEVGRYGGEEFLVVLPSTDLEGAYLCAERIRVRLENTKLGSRKKVVTSSFGVASYSDGITVENLIKKADELLYRAKKNGKNRVEK